MTEKEPALPLLPSASPFLIEERVKFPGLVLDYVVGALDPKHMDGPAYKEMIDGKEHTVRTHGSRLRDTEYIFPEPGRSYQHGPCA